MKNTPKPNILERAIAAISPAWALERHKARSMTALAGGYAGAGYQPRLQNWMPGGGDADADTVMDLPVLRGRARDLVRNSPIAGGALETEVTNVVGTGLMMRSRIDAKVLGLSDEAARDRQREFEGEFCTWAESVFCDATEHQNFFELQDLIYRARWASGDVGVVLADVERGDWPYRLALQVIEADRICNPQNKADSETLVQGIEHGDRGQPVTMHIADRHPGSYVPTKGTKWTAVSFRGSSGRRNVLHLMRRTRPGQTRGVPELAPIIEHLKQLARYSLAEVDAAVNSAAIAMFIKMDPDAFQDLFDDDAQSQIIGQAQKWDGNLQSGKAVNLLPGEEATSPMMGRPNPNFDPFVTAFMKQIGIGLNIPYEVLAKHFQSSYSAARAALLDAWRTFKVRRAWLATNLCQPVYEEWLADAVSTGRVKAPGFFADPAIRRAWCGAVWLGDGPGAIDPEKEAAAAEKRMSIGLSTLPEEIAAYDGGDWDTKHREAVRIQKARVDDGLQAPAALPPGSPGSAGPGGAPVPKPKPGMADPDEPLENDE